MAINPEIGFVGIGNMGWPRGGLAWCVRASPLM